MDNEELDIIETIPDLKVSTTHYKSWLVYLDGKLFDTVNYSDDMDIKQVRRSLITIDCYPREIEVIEE